MTLVGVVARVMSGPVSSALQRLAEVGAVETETEEQRLRRSTLVLSTFLVCALTPFWIVTYVALGLPVPASIPLAYLAVSIGSLVWFARTKRDRARPLTRNTTREERGPAHRSSQRTPRDWKLRTQ